MTDHLRREVAPVSDAAWEQIEQEARRTLGHYLAARAVVDVSGPNGWEYSAAPTGRIRVIGAASTKSIGQAVREVIPTLELRAPFFLTLEELDAADRGADIDLDALITAARAYAVAEDQAIFYGSEGSGAAGIVDSSPHDPIDITEDYGQYPGHVARAVAALKMAGIGGPYALALGPRCYTGVIETTEHGGYPLLEHLKLILGGSVVWAPAVDGAIVLSQRGGDYALALGEDISIGYQGQTADDVQLYLEGSFTFLVRDERAAIALRYPAEQRPAAKKI